ncbi:MAG: ABC transporter substrate-binding protein [Dehalococcoidia bacterium]|nr:ABC transporter substrate-binding protein [Dehalococcoidia bacterium]
MFTKKLSAMAAILLAAVFVAGSACSPAATPTPVIVTPTPGPTPTAAAAAETLLIGNLSILSGAGTGYGFPASRGLEKGVELWNGKGGVVAGGKRYMLKLDTYDWGYTADSGRTAAEKSMNAGAKIIFGVGTAPSSGAQQVTDPNKVLLFVASIADALVDQKYPYTFRNLNGAGDAFAPAMDYVWKMYPNNRKLFATAWNDATGKLSWDTWKPALEKMGWSKIDFQFYEPGTTDFAPFVNSYLVPSGADVLGMITRTGGETGQLVKAARQFGYKGVIVWAAGGGGGVQELSIAGDLADGVVVNQEWDWEGQFVNPAGQEVAREYIRKYGVNPSVHLINALDGLRMLEAALVKAGTADTTVLKNTFPTVEWDSYHGGKGKLWEVNGRLATFLYGMPVSVYNAKDKKLVNVGFGLPPRLQK